MGGRILHALTSFSWRGFFGSSKEILSLRCQIEWRITVGAPLELSDFTPNGMELVELQEGTTLDEVREKTEAAFKVNAGVMDHQL